MHLERCEVPLEKLHELWHTFGPLNYGAILLMLQKPQIRLKYSLPKPHIVHIIYVNRALYKSAAAPMPERKPNEIQLIYFMKISYSYSYML